MSQRNPSDHEVDLYAQEYLVNGGDQTKAWRVAFPKSKAKAESQHEIASRFHDLIKVRSRILELREIAAEKADEKWSYTVDKALEEYEEVRVKGLDQGQLSASVSAINGKVKVAGLDVQKIEHSGKDGKAIEIKAPSPKEWQKMRDDMIKEDDC